MNLYLSSTAPVLFLLIEAKFGPSKLQNYDSILRNQVLGSQLSLAWRLVLGLMMALPLGLSAAYKGFQGGQSAIALNASTLISNASHYGMFGPPGLQGLGEGTGLSLFNNATLPFMVASSVTDGKEPPLPDSAQAYGYNTLLLNSDSSAVLDIPQPRYITAIQSLLATGESWNITANVLATVATFNNTNTTDPKGYMNFFGQFCGEASRSSGAFAHMSLLNNGPPICVALLSPVDRSNQSVQFFGFAPDPGISHDLECDDFFPAARLYNIDRQLCTAVWSITPRNIDLVDGSCEGVLASVDQQSPVSDNKLFLPVWYMSSLAELLGSFSTTRNESAWLGPSIATGIAAMLWSRITVLNSAENLIATDPLPLDLHLQLDNAGQEAGFDLTYRESGLLYPVDDHIVYIRPSMQKSFWLYFILGVQPLLTLIMLGMRLLLCSTPIDKGFGLIAILSGLNTNTCEGLSGAALSGQLGKGVKLVITPTTDGERNHVLYSIESHLTASQNGRVVSGVVYH